MAEVRVTLRRRRSKIADLKQNERTRSSHYVDLGYVVPVVPQQHELIISRRYWTWCLFRPSSTIPIIPRLFPGWRACLPRICISPSQRDRPHLGRSYTRNLRSHRRLPHHANPCQVVLGRQQCRHRLILLLDNRSCLSSVPEVAYWRSSPALSRSLPAEHPTWTGDREWIQGDHVRSQDLHW